MGIVDSVKGFYYNLEDKWYDVLDALDKKQVPVYKIIDPIDKIIPSFLLFILLLLFILILLAYFVRFGVINEFTLTAIDSSSKVKLEGVVVSGNIDETAFSKVTGSDGKAVITVYSLGPNLFEFVSSLFFNSKQKYSAVISAEKGGYEKINKEKYPLSSTKADIKLVKMKSKDPNDPVGPFTSGAEVELIDNSTGERIVDPKGLAFVKYGCSNKSISPKTSSDGHDGVIDGKFKLVEIGCNFVVKGAYSPNYQEISGVNMELDPSKSLTSIKLTKLIPTDKGVVKIFFVEENSEPAKPLVGIKVRLLDLSGNSMVEGTTDYSGLIQEEVFPGNYLITGVSPDGTYYSLTSDANQLIVAKVGQIAQKTIYLRRMDPALARSLRIKVVDYNGKTPLKDVLVYPQQLVLGEEGKKNALGIIGYCANSCKTDANGLIVVTGLSSLDEGKIIVSLFKENYVNNIFVPTLFKTDSLEYQLIEMAKTDYDEDTGNAGKALVAVKSITNLRPLYPARTYLYYDSRELGISNISIIQSGKIVGENGEALFENIQKTNKDDYYAKAIYDSIEGNSNRKKIEAGKTTVFDVNINTAVSYFEVNLINGYAGTSKDVNNKQNAVVTITSKDQINPTPQRLIFDSDNNVFKSGLLDKGGMYDLNVSLEGYVPVERIVGLSINGKNTINVPMYTDIDEVQIIFKGFFRELSDAINPSIETGVNFLDLNNFIGESKGYYSSVDVVVGKTLKDGNVLGAIRVNDKLKLVNPVVTNQFFQQARLYSRHPQEKQPYNDDNYYVQSEDYEVDNGSELSKQLGVVWEGKIERGVYNITTELNFAKTTRDGDKIDFNYSAKQNDYLSISEARGNKRFEIGAPTCEVSENNPNCSGVYFITTFNGKSINSENYDYNSNNKTFSKLEEVVELDVEKGNELTIELFNNFEENLDFNLTLYSYNGSIEEFNNSPSGVLKFDSRDGSQFKKIGDKVSVGKHSRSTKMNVEIFSNQPKSSSLIVAVAQTNKGSYYLFISTYISGKKLHLVGGDFYSGVPNQTVHGEVVDSNGKPVELESVNWKILAGCKNEEIIREGHSSIDSINKSHFEMVIEGEYVYNKDCLVVNGVAIDPIYEELNEKRIADVGPVDPELQCTTIGLVNSLNNTDAFLPFGGGTTITITNNCDNSIKFIIESGLIIEGDSSGTLYPEEKYSFRVIGKNKNYNPQIRHSDILGVFPVSIKAKLESSAKNYSRIKLLKVHVSDDGQCFKISKDVFDLLNNDSESRKFFIKNDCQDNMFEDYYIPKTTLDLLGVKLNDYKPKYDYIDLNYELVVHGGSYGVERRAFSRKEVMITEVYDVSKIDSSRIGGDKDGLKEYKNFVITVRRDVNATSKKLMFKWIDDSENPGYGAVIDGDITIEYYDKPSVNVKVNNNFQFDSNNKISCEDPQLGHRDDYCECNNYEYAPGAEISSLRNGILYVIFPEGQVKSVSLNILASPNPKNLFINLKLFLNYDDYVFVPVLTGDPKTNVIQTGEFRIYPREEENVFLLREFTNPVINPELKINAVLCKRILTNTAWVEEGKIYWINKHVDNYGGVSNYCSSPSNAVIKSVESEGHLVTNIPQSLINKWNEGETIAQFNWMGVEKETKGFWTNECNQEADTCKVLNKTNDGFNLNNLVDMAKGNINNYVALCEQPIPAGVNPNIITYDYCKALNIVCDSDSGVCEDGLNQLFDAFQTAGYIDVINPMTELRVVSAKTNNADLDNSTVMVWIEGGILKAKFLGKNYEGHDDKTIDLEIIDEDLVGDVYGRLKIVDYINKINYVQ